MKTKFKTIDNSVFISGKVTGMDYEAVKKKFIRKEEMLSNFFNPVYNPTKLCDVSWGYWHCMLVCLLKLIKSKNVYFLSNWKDSRGARIEMRVSKILGKTILFE